jgi:hypothetical protein
MDAEDLICVGHVHQSKSNAIAGSGGQVSFFRRVRLA